MKWQTDERTAASGDEPAGEGRRSVLIVAGEASGDLHGSRLVEAMRRLDPSVRFSGIGGKKMERVGVDILFSSAEMAVVGLTEVFSKLVTIARASRRIKAVLKKEHPHLLILIDYPEFNIHAAKHALRFRVPVLYYISPQVWAWRGKRVKKIARRVDRLAVILPFEEPFYRRKGVQVDYVGHPLMDTVPREPPVSGGCGQLDLRLQSTVLGLLPGSRKEEIRNLLPAMIQAAEMVRKHVPGLVCVLPLAETIDREFMTAFVRDSSVEVVIIEGNTLHALAKCRAAMVTSGTATLEAAIMGVPMVVVYRVSPISYWVGKRVIHVPHISLVNLVSGREAVKELIQDAVTPENLFKEIMPLLGDGPEREAMVRDLREVRRSLGERGASDRAARIAINMMRSGEEYTPSGS